MYPEKLTTWRLVAIATVLAVLALALPVHAAAVGAEEEGGVFVRNGKTIPRSKVLVVGGVSNSATKHQPKLEAFADWLAPRLKRQGIVAGAGIVVPNIGAMVELLRRGRVDIVSESVLTAMIYEERAGAEILMAEWKDGRPYYQTVFIAPRKSAIFQLEDLVGRRLAFEDRGSTTGFLLPLAALLRAGLKPVALENAESPVPEGTVGYVFARSESNISAWTASGLIDAGAYSNRDWERKKTNPKRFRNKLRIFHVTPPLIHAVVVARVGMAPGLKKAVIDALNQFGTSSDAISVRDTYYGVARFASITGRTAKDLDEARAIYQSMRGHLR